MTAMGYIFGEDFNFGEHRR